MSGVAYRKPFSGLFQTLLGSARPVSAYWDDMFEPWQPPVENSPPERKLPTLSFYDSTEPIGGFPTASGNNANQLKQSGVSQGGYGLAPAPPARLLSDGTEILSDALPDPVLAGQQYAQAGSGGRPPRRSGGGPPEGPLGRLLSDVYQAKLRTLAELEPNNRFLSTIQSPDWRPAQRHIDRLDLEIIKARQRAPGAVDTQESGIGIGPFARESIPARSGKRDFTEQERAEVTRLGYLYGCHTCGTRDPGSATGNFSLDHQRPTRLNPFGEGQRLFPQCMSCMHRQGGLIAKEVTREEP